MASPSSTAIFVLFLLSATLVLPSHAQLIKGLKVAGRLYCSADGNYCPTCSGLGGVNVIITCNNGTTTIGSLLTDTHGFIDGVLGLAGGILYPTLVPCYATVQLPVANCPLLPPTGILKAPLNLVDFITGIVGGILGLCAHLRISVWIVVKVIL